MPIRRDLNRKTASGRRIFGTALAGVPGRAVPATGSNGRPGYLYAGLQFPDDADRLVRGEILSRSSGLVIDADEDSSYTASGPNGAHWFTFQAYLDDEPLDSPQTANFTLDDGTRRVELAAAALAQPAFAGELLHGVTLAGAALGSADAQAGLLHAVPLAAAAEAVSDAHGQITITAAVAGLSAAAIARAHASAALALRIDFSAAALAQATAAASLGASPVALGADARASSSAGAALWLSVPLDAAALAQVSAGGALVVEAGFAAAALAQAGSSATLALHCTLSAQAATHSTMVAGLLVIGPLGGALGSVVRGRKRNWRVRRLTRTAA